MPHFFPSYYLSWSIKKSPEENTDFKSHSANSLSVDIRSTYMLKI